MNVRRIAVTMIVLAGGLLCTGAPPAWTDDLAGDLDPQTREEQRENKLAKRTHMRLGKQRLRNATGLDALKGALKRFCDSIDQVWDDIEAGFFDVNDIIDQLAMLFPISNASETLLSDVMRITEAVNAQIALDAENVAAPAQAADPTLLDMLVGDCGSTDTLRDKLDKEVAKLAKAARRKLKKFKKQMETGGEVDVNTDVDVPAQAPPPVNPAPPNKPPMPKPKKKFRVDSKASSARFGVAGGGILCVGGQADRAGGNQIDVKLFDADGNEVGSQAGVIIDPRCRWRVCFTNLPSGPYRIQAVETSGGTPVEQDFSVPSARPR